MVEVLYPKRMSGNPNGGELLARGVAAHQPENEKPFKVSAEPPQLGRNLFQKVRDLFRRPQRTQAVPMSDPQREAWTSLNQQERVALRKSNPPLKSKNTIGAAIGALTGAAVLASNPEANITNVSNTPTNTRNAIEVVGSMPSQAKDLLTGAISSAQQRASNIGVPPGEFMGEQNPRNEVQQKDVRNRTAPEARIVTAAQATQTATALGEIPKPAMEQLSHGQAQVLTPPQATATANVDDTSAK